MTSARKEELEEVVETLNSEQKESADEGRRKYCLYKHYGLVVYYKSNKEFDLRGSRPEISKYNKCSNPSFFKRLMGTGEPSKSEIQACREKVYQDYMKCLKK